MAYDIWYSIKGNRIKGGCVKGFEYDESGRLELDPKTNEHSVFYKVIEGSEDDAEWGRLSCTLLSSEEIVCYTYVLTRNNPEIVTDAGEVINLDDYLADSQVDSYDKVRLMTSLGAEKFINCENALLYDLKGRFLYVAVEMMGFGDAVLQDVRVSAVGDAFMNTFPQVYQERNSFFHRFMSIFSSVYGDIGEMNDNLFLMLDLDMCNQEMLETYGSWFGIDLKGGFLEEDVLRTLVKEAYHLNKIKGTKQCIRRILEIVLGEEVVLIENRVQGGGTYDVTVLISRHLTEDLRHQLTFLLDQFKPVRTRIRLLQMEKEAVMDGNSYMDMNATIPGEKHVVLDEESLYDGAITLT